MTRLVCEQAIPAPPARTPHMPPLRALRAPGDAAQKAVMADDVQSLRHAPWSELTQLSWLNGLRPLTLAAMLGHQASVKCLLERGCPIDDCDLFGHTPLHWAEMTQQHGVTDLLIKAGANTDACNVFFATPRDGVPFGAGALPTATLRINDGERVHAFSAPTIQRLLGWTAVSRPIMRADTANVWLRAMHDEDLVDRIVRARPRAAAPTQQDASVALAYYGADVGWGVQALDCIDAHTFVGTYAGLVVPSDATDPCRLHYVSTPLPMPLSRLGLVIDAADVGSWATRVNGAHDPAYANLDARPGWRHGMPVLELWARQPIAAGHQLLFDYGRTYWRQIGIEPHPIDPATPPMAWPCAA